MAERQRTESAPKTPHGTAARSAGGEAQAARGRGGVREELDRIGGRQMATGNENDALPVQRSSADQCAQSPDVPLFGSDVQPGNGRAAHRAKGHSIGDPAPCGHVDASEEPERKW